MVPPQFESGSASSWGCFPHPTASPETHHSSWQQTPGGPGWRTADGLRNRCVQTVNLSGIYATKNYTLPITKRFDINIWLRFSVTISGISKFGKIVKLLLWVLGVQRLNNMLERIIHSPRHPPLCVRTNLKRRNISNVSLFLNTVQ